MKITEIRTTPLVLPFRHPFHWSQGMADSATVLLIEVETDEGLVGYGESIGAPSAATAAEIVRNAGPVFLGQSPFHIARLIDLAHRSCFAGVGTAAPRFANQIFAGVEMALWDVVGKSLGKPVHQLFGGAVRRSIPYCAFPQGETLDELAQAAKDDAAAGYSIIFVKVGLGEETDIRNVATVREAIGPARLRLDANEAWDTLTAIHMIRKLARYGPEYVEQPTPAHSVQALARVKEAVEIPIAADQSVYTLGEIYEICLRRAADLIVLGVHEAGGMLGFRKAAAVAEAAGINICLHGSFESGITTCAGNQVAATISNLDDGNPNSRTLLSEDIVAAPDLVPVQGRVDIMQNAGLGFDLDQAAIGRAADRFKTLQNP